MEKEFKSCILNFMDADDFVTQGARASAAMILTWFVCNNPDPAW